MIQVVVSYVGNQPLVEEIVTGIGKIYGASFVQKVEDDGISEIEFVVKDHEVWGYADENSEKFVDMCNRIPDVDASIEATDVL